MNPPATTGPARSTSSTISLVIAGSGGAGAITAGALLLDAAAQAGWYALMARSTGPQIRGGEAAAMIRLGTEPVDNHDDHYHLLAAIDWGNVSRFAVEIPLNSDSLIIADPDEGDTPEVMRAGGAKTVAVAMKQIAKKVPGGRANMVALGVVSALIGLPESALLRALEKNLGRKGADAIAASMASIRAGFDAASPLPALRQLGAVSAANEVRWAISGNEATGYGALRGGIRFVAAYPITPATEILEWLAPALPRLGGVLVQAEDELASINQIIGASFGGTPSLTATSGPGLSLMSESIGLAVAAEIPVVVVDVMRGGPSTGIPTKSEQADLDIALHGLHGDAPHVVLAPTSIADCIPTTEWAVGLAEALQTAVIVLTDQATGQSRCVIRKPAATTTQLQRAVLSRSDESAEYKRYALTPSGVSPMAIPGLRGGQYTADGLEHNEAGTPSSQAADHASQLAKRARKLDGHDYGGRWADLEGDGDTAIITWGSCTGPAREARARALALGKDVRLLAVRLLAPARPADFAHALRGVRRALIVEQSASGQFHRMLRAYYTLPGEVQSLARPGPLPIRPDSILSTLLAWT